MSCPLAFFPRTLPVPLCLGAAAVCAAEAPSLLTLTLFILAHVIKSVIVYTNSIDENYFTFLKKICRYQVAGLQRRPYSLWQTKTTTSPPQICSARAAHCPNWCPNQGWRGLWRQHPPGCGVSEVLGLDTSVTSRCQKQYSAKRVQPAHLTISMSGRIC